MAILGRLFGSPGGCESIFGIIDTVSSRGTETVTVLMTDLVGSTAMADRLGPAAAEELRTEHFGLLRGALERTGGREVKNLGDGLMVVFGSASQALACAVEMQQALDARNQRRGDAAKLSVRVGVSLGEASVQDGDYFGAPAVEAARLCAHAEGGQVVVNGLARQLGGALGGHDFRPLGDLQLKGITEPVPAYALHWEPAPEKQGMALPERLRELPPTGYVGRVAERAELKAHWQQAREGSPRLVLISGEAGVGKTRLSTHLGVSAHSDGAVVLYGRSDEDLGVPYQPWAQALRHLVVEAPQPLLRAHVERCGGELARLAPALAERVPDAPSPRQGDQETERYLLYAATTDLLRTAAESAPVILILDDLHWADRPTLTLLRHVLSAGPSARMLIVGTYRDSDLSRDHPLTALLADLHRERGVHRLRLQGLEVGDVHNLLQAIAGHDRLASRGKVAKAREHPQLRRMASSSTAGHHRERPANLRVSAGARLTAASSARSRAVILRSSAIGVLAARSVSSSPSTRYTVQGSGMPFRTCSPRLWKLIPEPTTRSLTVLDTNSSPDSPSAAMRAPMCIAIPARSSPIASHSPVWRPARMGISERSSRSISA